MDVWIALIKSNNCECCVRGYILNCIWNLLKISSYTKRKFDLLLTFSRCVMSSLDRILWLQYFTWLLPNQNKKREWMIYIYIYTTTCFSLRNWVVSLPLVWHINPIFFALNVFFLMKTKLISEFKLIFPPHCIESCFLHSLLFKFFFFTF